MLVDNLAGAIFLEEPAGDARNCRLVSLPPSSPAVGSNYIDYTRWYPFTFTVTVTPNTTAYLYFLLYNLEAPGTANGTGLRLEFTSAYFANE